MFTLLNIFGLAISISAAQIIYRIVTHEFSYDSTLPNTANTYKVITAMHATDRQYAKMDGVAAPLYQGIRENIPGVVHAVPVFKKTVNSLKIKVGDAILTRESPEDIIATDGSYFSMVPYKWIAGSPALALKSPHEVVLTESRAKAYFPRQKPENIINRNITYYEWSDTVTRKVVGIVADYPMPSQFTYQEFVSLPKMDFQPVAWTNTSGSDQLFIQIRQEASVSTVLEQINALSARKWKQFAAGSGKPLPMSKSYALIPIREVHFATDVEDYGVTRTSKPVMYGLAGIGFFLLLLACINYINISAAQIPPRGKEIGVRKVLGSSRGQLINQFILETLLTTVLASLLSLVLSKAGFGVLKDMIPEGVTLFGPITETILFMAALVVVITCMAGLYPGWLITKLKAIHIFRNFSVNPHPSHKFSLQKGLIAFQFVIALIFITSAIIVGSQLRYTLQADMGFNKDAVVLVSVPWKYLHDPRYQGKQFALLNRLKHEQGIVNTALGDAPLSSAYSSSPFVYEEDGKPPVRIQTYKKWGDTAYLGLYQFKLLAGRNLHASDTISEYLINASAAKAFGFPSPRDAVGQMIAQLGHPKVPIVGVVQDFNTQDFYASIKPVAISNSKENLSTFNIKLQTHNPSQWQRTLRAVEKQWYSFYPAESFHYRFYDETLEGMYTQERQIAKLIDLATIITIFISCLGLFGLAALTAFRRTKEIGIRKVLGASALRIMAMFSREYIILVFLALLVSTPVVWWAMHQWLQDFAYKIDIRWWMFASAGAMAIVIAVMTISLHAIKAATASPAKTLRTE